MNNKNRYTFRCGNDISITLVDANEFSDEKLNIWLPPAAKILTHEITGCRKAVPWIDGLYGWRLMTR